MARCVPCVPTGPRATTTKYYTADLYYDKATTKIYIHVTIE